MKINQQYLKDLLEAFEASETPTTDIFQLKNHGIDFTKDEDLFVFHLRILNEMNLIQKENGGIGFGYSRGGGGTVSWSAIPLRLTYMGHEFLEALRNKDVWERISTDFKEASISTLWDVSKDLLKGVLKKKVENILGDN